MSAIKLSHITKEFNIQHESEGTLLRSLWSYIKPTKLVHRPLRDVSLSIDKGEVVALIGNNGAGKSTLLKLIARIYHPTSGSIETTGSVLFLGGISKGLKQRLSVIDNIHLIAALFGLTSNETKEAIPRILNNAQLEEYAQAKIYQLSRGMQQRLSFSLVLHCALHRERDIILLDEVFSKGGDVRFKKKAKKKIREFIEESKTVIMVSHNTNVVKKFATRVIWIDDGGIKEDGDPDMVIDHYLRANESTD